MISCPSHRLSAPSVDAGAGPVGRASRPRASQSPCPRGCRWGPSQLPDATCLPCLAASPSLKPATENDLVSSPSLVPSESLVRAGSPEAPQGEVGCAVGPPPSQPELCGRRALGPVLPSCPRRCRVMSASKRRWNPDRCWCTVVSAVWPILVFLFLVRAVRKG